MIDRRFFLGLAAATMLAFPARADDTRLNASEIEELLAGNTIEGDWGGAYKQYFAEDGSTVYYPDGGDPDEGKWRVNAEEDTYESWWESADWMGYKVLRADDGYAWQDAAGDTYPFTVMEGKQAD